ncbi:MAG: GGDEF domain-containing protein [Gammaproteobacteria bacterium]|nr:GGDEF domain-containing protein [Gammaproteobacteria bacterium]
MTQDEKNPSARDDLLDVNDQLRRLAVRLSYGVNEYERPLLSLLADIRKYMQEPVDSGIVQDLQQELGHLLGDIHALPEQAQIEIPFSLFQQLLASPKLPASDRKQLSDQAVKVIKEKGSLNAEPWNELVRNTQRSIDRLSVSEDSKQFHMAYSQAEKTLTNLLDTLGLPDFENNNISAIKTRLKTVNSLQALVDCIDDVYSIIVKYHDDKTRHNIEDFLLEMKQNLLDMQGLVSGLVASQKDSLKFSSNFGRTLENSIVAMNQHIDTATDLNNLKQEIKQSMHSISSSLEKFSIDTQNREHNVGQEMKEVNARMNALEIVSEGLKDRLASERKMAMQDPLTGVHNRLAYDERIDDELERYQRYESPFVLLVWDLDHFKNVNDSYGHLAGDKVLQSVAEMLVTCTRRVDFVSRFGGEEFVVIMPNTQIDSALKVAEKIRNRIEKVRFHYNNTDLDVTISCGLAEVAEGDTVESLFKRADDALYQAKDRGRNRCMSANTNADQSSVEQ